MKNIILIEPHLRFSRTSTELIYERFNPESNPINFGEHLLPLDYKCEKCMYKVSIKISDFDKHFKSNNSNLNNIEKKLLDDFVEEHKLGSFSYIDFYCPKCKLPIRILYDRYPSGKGDSYYELKNVLEIINA